MPGKAAALPHICKPMSDIPIQVPNITYTVCFTKWNQKIDCAWSVIMIYPDFSSAHELQSYTNKHGGFGINQWGCVSFSNTGTQYCLDCAYCQKGLADILCRICHNDMPKILQSTWTLIIVGQQMQLCTQEVSSVSYCDRRTQYHLVSFYCQMGLAVLPYWICHKEIQAICQGFSSAPELPLYTNKCCSLAINKHAQVS